MFFFFFAFNVILHENIGARLVETPKNIFSLVILNFGFYLRKSQRHHIQSLETRSFSIITAITAVT